MRTSRWPGGFVFHHRGGGASGIIEADHRSRLGHQTLLFAIGKGRHRRHPGQLVFVGGDGHRETEMIAKGRFGFELVDGDANGHANVEQVRRDALNNKKCLFNNKDGISASTSSFAPSSLP